MVRQVASVHRSVAKLATVLLQSALFSRSFQAKKNSHTPFVWCLKFSLQTVPPQWHPCVHQACRSWMLACPLRLPYPALQWVSSMQRASTSHSPTSSVQKTHSATWTSRLLVQKTQSPHCSSTPRSTVFLPTFLHQHFSRHVMHVWQFSNQ